MVAAASLQTRQPNDGTVIGFLQRNNLYIPLLDPRQFITGNFLGYGFDGFDHFAIAKPLTFASWDDYVGTGHLDDGGVRRLRLLCRSARRDL